MAPSSHLDELLTAYLQALDEYTKLRTSLSEAFSTAFLSLAHARILASPTTAHFGLTPALFSGRRPRGARLRCSITPSDDDAATNSITIYDISEARETKEDVQPSPTPASHDDDSASANASLDTPDPLRVLGLFPPPALRTSQAEFVRAVQGPVAELVAAETALKDLEARIRAERRRRGDAGGSEGPAAEKARMAMAGTGTAAAAATAAATAES